MHNFSKMQDLLERYWEGETTVEEERLLRAYFASGMVDERLLRFAPLFQALNKEKTVQMPGAAKILEMKPRTFAWHGWAAAASVALLLTAGFLWWNNPQLDDERQAAQPVAPRHEIPATQNDPARKPAIEEIAERETKPYHKPGKPPVRKKTPPVDPEAEKAMEEIKAALALVSSKIKKGKNEAAKGAVHLENVDKIFKIKPDTEG